MADFDPYYEWLAIPPRDQPPHAYRLLGIELFESNPKVIESAAEQRILLLRSRAGGKHSEHSQTLLNEVSKAQILLLNAEKKAKYDADLQARLGPRVPSPVKRGAAEAPPAEGLPLPVILGGAGSVLVLVVGAILFLNSGSPPKPPEKNPAEVAINKPGTTPEKKSTPPTPAPMPVPPKPAPAPMPMPAAVEPMPTKMPDPPTPMPAPVDPPVVPVPMPAPLPMPAPPMPPVEVPADPRKPIPEAAQRTAALKDFEALFAADIAAAKKPEQWQALADQWSKVARETQDDPAVRYVLFEKSIEAAAAAGNWDQVEKLVVEQANDFQVAESQLRRAAVLRALAMPSDATRKAQTLQRGLKVLDALIADEDYAAATELATQLGGPVRDARNKELLASFAATRGRLEGLQTAAAAAIAARKQLEANPNDVAAHFELGKFEAIRGQDWRSAATHLELAADPAWSEAAKKELAAPRSADEQAALANAWWLLAEKSEGAVKQALRLRAGFWYQLALPQLEGLARAKADARLNDLGPVDWSAYAAAAGTGSSLAAPYVGKLTIGSARYGAEGQWKDVTDVVRKQVAADPFTAIQADDRVMGDPAPGKQKQLQVFYTVDGQRGSIAIKQQEVSSVPVLPFAGIPVRNASQGFRVVAARFGAGLTWTDATETVRGRIVHPGEPVAIKGFAWHDAWFGVPKHLVIWFDYEGKRYARAIRDGDTKQLLEGIVAPPLPVAAFKAEYKKDHWERGMKAPVQLGPSEQAFGVITEIGGFFLGGGEKVRLFVDADGNWALGDKGDQTIAVHGMAIATPLRDKFLAKTEEFSWSPGAPAVKMIHSSEGFCVLSMVQGDFGGGGEGTWVTIDPKDGFWYLHGMAANGKVWSSATAYRLKPNAGVKLRYAEHLVRGYSTKLLEKDRGFCFLSGMLGNFRGYGEQARVIRTPNGDWELRAQNCSARAYAVIVE